VLKSNALVEDRALT